MMAKKVKAVGIKNFFKTVFIKTWWVKTVFNLQSHVPPFFIYAKLLDAADIDKRILYK